MTLVEDIDTLTSGYLAALKSNSDEIARLAEALRHAEAERNEERKAHTELIAEYERLLGGTKAFKSERDAARADAERLADALIAAQKSITFEIEQEARESRWSLPITVAFKMRDALAAHRVASGKAVTP